MNRSSFLSGLLLLVTIAVSAQDKSIPSLRTEGKGEIKTAPDRTIVYMEVNSRSMNFNQAIQDLNKKYSILEKEITTAGFAKADIQTSGYTIDKNIVYTQQGPVDSGFIGRQTFTIEFPNEQAKIIKLVKAFSESKADLSYNFQFTLSDAKRKQVEGDLLKKAVTDASDKAKLLSSSAGVSLKRIISIEYGQPEILYRAPSVMMDKRGSMAGEFSGFNVKDLELSDKVTITWEIGQP